ncbi:hypothetical protein IAD21_00257 [Abditibacteriota bacterium]|nr:hypothetical protein IAD21_00257 [Abditibacteriota bacterium]
MPREMRAILLLRSSPYFWPSMPSGIKKTPQARRRDVYLVCGSGGLDAYFNSGVLLLVDDYQARSQTLLVPVLTAHEKLELRLSLPREFWPKQWQGELEVS